MFYGNFSNFKEILNYPKLKCFIEMILLDNPENPSSFAGKLDEDKVSKAAWAVLVNCA